MCGRYVLFSAMEAIRDLFGLGPLPGDAAEWARPRYNVAPTQRILIVRPGAGTVAPELAAVRWGLVPSWARGIDDGPLNVNARAETVAEKPSFRSAFRRRRCLVPADGFYEWQKRGRQRLPYFFRHPGDELLSFAGLWERWGEGEAAVESCAIITTSANPVVEPVHHRMPVIIAPGARELWLDPTGSPDAVGRLLRPAPSDVLVAHPVSHAVNRADADGAELIRPQPEEPGGEPSVPPKGQLSLW